MPTLFEVNDAMAAMQQRAPKMFIRDLKTLERLEAQFNPDHLEETLNVEWVRLAIPGLSHRRKQYNYTDDHKISFELIFDALLADVDGGGMQSIEDARRFLLSLCYAKRGAQRVQDGQATRVLFVWPKFMSLTCVITSLKFKHARFNVEGRPSYFTVSVSVEEIRDARLDSEAVRNDGTLRSSASANEDG